MATNALLRFSLPRPLNPERVQYPVDLEPEYEPDSPDSVSEYELESVDEAQSESEPDSPDSVSEYELESVDEAQSEFEPDSPDSVSESEPEPVDEVQSEPDSPDPVPIQEPQQVPAEADHAALAASLKSSIEESIERKFALEKEGALLSPSTPQGERETVEVPEGECCALMCEAIPPGFGVKIHDSYFDVRYFVKAMLTQERPISPYTKSSLTTEEMGQITEILGIDADDFTKIWKWSEEYEPLYRNYCEHLVEANRNSYLGDIPASMIFARLFGLTDQYNALSDQAGRIISIQVNEHLKVYKPKLRGARFQQLLELAVLRKRISPEFSKSISEALKDSENSLNA